MTYQRPNQPLKWHGGKAPLATRIIALMPPRCLNPNKPDPSDKGWLHYVEPYAGGLAVLLANDPEGISEVVNDTNHWLTNFWDVLQSDTAFTRFCRIAVALPFDELRFYQALDNFKTDVLDVRDVKAAVDFFIVNRQSLAGRMAGFAVSCNSRTRRGMNESVSAWLSGIEGLPEVHARLRRVLIRNQPATKVIVAEDGPRTIFYLDPPYLHETRASTDEYGENEMTEDQHGELLTTIDKIAGRFLLSGYRSRLYDAFAKTRGWRRKDFHVDNKASGAKKKRRMIESVWMNY
jgi:DNA adenine methylase